MQIHGPSQVHGAQPLKAPHSLRGASASDSPAAGRPADGGDRLELSQESQIAARLSEIPDIRHDRVAELRAAIEAGTYETEEKLNTALDRLLDEIG